METTKEEKDLEIALKDFEKKHFKLNKSERPIFKIGYRRGYKAGRLSVREEYWRWGLDNGY